MAVYTSNGTGGGNWSAGATWSGGVKPPSGAGHSIVIAATDTVTYDEAAGEYGDDTSTAITVNGVLKFSRAASTQLTVKGHIFTAATTTATIDIGRNSTADPIPAGVTATLILNKSAAMANYKYGLFIADTSNFYACGATKTNNARITSTISAGGTSCTVDDATGWAVGDTIVMAASDGTYNHYDKKTIATITPGAGTTATITFAATTYAHGTNCPISNLTSNVTIKNYNTSNYSFICFRHTSTTSNNRREVDYVSFQYVGSNSAQVNTQIFVSSSTSTLITPFVTCSHNTLYNGCFTNGLFLNNWNSGGFYLDNWTFFGDDGALGAVFYTASGTYVGLKNSVFIYTGGVSVQSAFSQGGQGCLFTDNTFCSTLSSFLVNWTNGDGGIFTRCGFHSTPVAFTSINCGSAQFINCNFGSLSPVSPCPSLWGTPVASYINNTNTNASKGEWLFSDCCFMTPSSSFNTFNVGAATPNPQWILKVSNKNLDPLTQEIYTPNGNIVRDNTSKVSGVQSLKMSPVSSSNALTFTLKVPAPTGQSVSVSGYLWRDTANTATVTLSGLGITPSVYTASGSLSANEQFVVTGTQTTGTDGFLTLTFSITGTSGNMWVDKIAAPQAAAIDFGEFGYWADGLPASIVSANYVSPFDVWNLVLTEAYAADGVAPTANQILFMLWSKMSEMTINGTTMTCRKLDGSTSMTFTLDSTSNPMSITRTT